MGSSRKSPRRRRVQPPSRSLPIFEREAMIRRRFSTRPMPIWRRTCDIGVDVQANAFRTCTAPIPQVAERLGVAPRPSERRCRPGPQGRGRERPPYSACLIRHRRGLGCALPSQPSPGVAPGPSIPCGKAKSACLDTHARTRPPRPWPRPREHRGLGRRAGDPPPRSGARHPSGTDRWCWSDPKGTAAGGAQAHPASNPYQALGLGGHSSHGLCRPRGTGRTGRVRASPGRASGCAPIPVRTAEAPKCASDPHVVCALRYGRRPGDAHRWRRPLKPRRPPDDAAGASPPRLFSIRSRIHSSASTQRTTRPPSRIGGGKRPSADHR